MTNPACDPSRRRGRSPWGQSIAICLAGAIPLVVVLSLVWTYRQQQSGPRQTLQAMTANERLIHASSQFTLELQRERLAAMQCLMQPGATECARAREELLEATDRALGEFQNALAGAQLGDNRLEPARRIGERLRRTRSTTALQTPGPWQHTDLQYTELVESALSATQAAVEAKTDRGLGKVFGKVALLQHAREASARVQVLLCAHRLSPSGLAAADRRNLSHLWTVTTAFLDSPLSGLGSETARGLREVAASPAMTRLHDAIESVVHHGAPLEGERLEALAYLDRIDASILAAEEKECSGLHQQLAHLREEEEASGRRMALYTWAGIASEAGLLGLIAFSFRSRRRLYDIHTALLREEEALRQTLDEQHAVFDSSLVGIMVLRSRIITKVNPCLCDMLGYTAEEMVGKGPQQLHLSPENFEEFGRRYYWRLAQQDLVKIEYPLRHKDGRTVWCQFSGRACAPPDLARGAVWVIEDITDRKRAQDALRDSERRLRVMQQRFEYVLATTRTTLNITDADFNLEYADPALQERHGDARGRKCYEYFMQAAAPCPGCGIPEAMRTRQPVVTRTRILREQGRPVEVHTIPFADDEGAWHVAEFKIDLTEHTRAEDALKAANSRLTEMAVQAKSANAAKSAFLANMSHEIRTPMTAILGFADLLKDSLAQCGGSDCHAGAEELAARQEHLKTIQRNGEHLLGLINDMLDLSKIEAGKLHVEHIECSPIQIVEEVLSLMRVRAVEKGLLLEAQYDFPLPQAVLSDPTRLRQVLVNLIGNALKFTPAGRVDVSVRHRAASEGLSSLDFVVRDTGIGMTPEQLERLFQPFSQADASTTRHFGGTGLGLTISKRLAEALGGDIQVESRPGQGSVFTLTISVEALEAPGYVNGAAEAPVRPGRQREAEASRPHHLYGRVLLAEDGRDNQRLISTILRKAGAEVDVAENGRLAVERVQDAQAAGRPYDIILMDMQMPEMDGYQATLRLRALGVTTPIVALTAHAMAGDRQKCLDSGCTDYASKPIQRTALLTQLAGLLGQTSGPGESEATVPAASAASPVLQSEFAHDPDVADLIPAFLASLPGQLAEMREALQHGDFERLTRLSHQLKGAGGGYGYPTITNAAGRVEHAGRTGDAEGAALSLSALETLCRSAHDGMQQMQACERRHEASPNRQ